MKSQIRTLAWLCAAWLTIAGGTAHAGQTTSPPPHEPERVDLIDLIRHWRHKPPPPPDEHDRLRVVFAPLIGAKPSTGFRFGVGANFEVALGDETSRLSSLNTGVTVSTRGDVAATFEPTLFGAGERWLLNGRNQFSPTEANDVAGGTLAASDGSVVAYDSIRVFDTFGWRIAPHVYAGAGLFYAVQSQISVEPGAENTSAFVAYSTAHGFDLQHQVSAGPAITLIVDSRDHPNDAGRGFLADVSYRMYAEGFLGGDSDWQRLLIDLRAYRRLTADGRHRLALWSFTDVVTSGVAPYLERPAVGADMRGRSGRGYAEGQIRGDRLTAFEAEYRLMLTKNGLIGLVAFANAATVGDDERGVRLFESFQPAGGAGVRFQLQKRSRTNLGVDFGLGRNGSRRFYVSLTDAF